MSVPTNTINGYLIKQIGTDQWWIADASDENVAGPFTSEQSAIEVASVFQDLPAAPARKGKSKS